VSKRWIIDTSPLILLHKINSLRLLPELCEELVIPKAVADELLSYEEDRSDWKVFIYESAKITALEDVLQIPADIAGWGLGKGESEVMAYAMANTGHEAVLDDLDARKCASTFNIPLRGTVGIILLAKKKNVIPAAKPLIDALKNAGSRFNDDWLNKALNIVGED